MKLIIVDDEPIIRKGIHHHIDWGIYDIEVVGEASNGKEGYELALSLHPDIILTDIRMPIMSGIDMAKKIKELFPDIAIIFLSGYDEQDYLHSAITIGVNDYILKNANSQNILESVLRCKEQLLVKKRQEQKMLDILLSNNLDSMHSSFVFSILQGNITSEDLEKQLSLFDSSIKNQLHILLLVPCKDEVIANKLMFDLSMLYNMQKPYLIYNKELGGVSGFLNISSDESINDFLFSTSMSLHNKYETCIFIYSSPFSSLANAYVHFEKMTNIVKSICWYQEQVVIFSECNTPSVIPEDLTYLLEQDILTAYHQKDTKRFDEKMKQYFTLCENMLLPLPLFQESMRRLIINIYGKINAYETAYELCTYINEHTDPYQIFDFVICELQKKLIPVIRNPIVYAAQKYIEDNHNIDVSLNDIAGHCHVTPSYLSKLFKDTVHLGTIEYMHTIRIEHAKRLLTTTDMKISEIAESVGYPNYKRFSLYFLKYTHTSPSDFRRNKC